jgi:anti-sigma factor RsiW
MEMKHINDRNLEDYSSGLLPDARLAEVEEHLLVCPQCQQQLARADEFAVLFRETAPGVVPSRRWWRLGDLLTPSRPAMWAGAAAALVLAIVVPLQLRESPPATVLLHSLRGPESAAQAPGRRPLRLVLDVPPQSAGMVEIVDPAGKPVVSMPAEIQGGQPIVNLKKMDRGSYWVRIYSKADPSELLVEYGLNLR